MPTRQVALALLAVVVALSATSAAQAPDRRPVVREKAPPRRLALVVGNDSYVEAPLRNARNDARAVAAALREVGFIVTEANDIRRSDFGAALEAFSRGLTSNDVALFYFAGHGLQLENENYLLPVDFKGDSETAARWDTIPVGRVHDALRKAQVAMIVLDACRNNPFSGSRAAGGGLAAMEARGSLIAFAAGAGQTASDNSSSANGLFTTHFLSALRTPGIGVREVFRRTRELVVGATNGRQFPAVYDGLVGEFVFRGTAPAPLPPAPTPEPVPGLSVFQACDQERLLKSVDSGVPVELEFVNRGGAPRKFFWLDYSGQRIVYQVLNPNQSYRQPTYVGHPWLISDAANQCVAILIPARGQRQVIVP